MFLCMFVANRLLFKSIEKTKHCSDELSVANSLIVLSFIFRLFDIWGSLSRRCVCSHWNRTPLMLDKFQGRYLHLGFRECFCRRLPYGICWCCVIVGGYFRFCSFVFFVCPSPSPAVNTYFVVNRGWGWLFCSPLWEQTKNDLMADGLGECLKSPITCGN